MLMLSQPCFSHQLQLESSDHCKVNSIFLDYTIFLQSITKWHDKKAAEQGPSDVRTKHNFRAASISEAKKILLFNQSEKNTH
jgi:hypothetical protein